MSAGEPLEGFWTSPKQMPGTLYHFFVQGDAQSVCGRWRLREMGEDRENRKPGHADCNKCAEIHAELFAVKPAVSTEEPAWTVKTDDHDKTHVLYFRGKEQSRVHGPVGLRTQNEMAELFNRTGKKPEGRKKVKCAADAPNPEKYVAKNADKSPELPLDVPATRKFVESDYPELAAYLDSLVDDSEIGSVARPAFLDDVERLVGEIREESPVFLTWVMEWSDPDFQEVDRWLAASPPLSRPRPQPLCLADEARQSGIQMDGEQRYHLRRWINFAIRFDPRRRATAAPEQPTKQTQTETKAMSATKTEKAKPFTAPVVNDGLPPAGEMPAKLFRRSPDNRVITAEQIEKMSDSVRAVGVLQPITARLVENTETGEAEYEIVLGECRWRGCLAIDENYLVPCFIRNLSDKDAARIRAIENFQRKDLDEVEEARAIQNLKDTGWSVDEIMTFLGVKKDHVYQRLTLLKLDDQAQEALRDGSISLGTAVKLASIPEEKRADALKAVVTPTHSAKSLPEREALGLLDRDFIEPDRKSKEWEKRKKQILEEHPGAKWMGYEEAGRIGIWNSGYVFYGSSPSRDLLSDAARAEELVVPIWGDLAKKHGAELVIGRNHNDEVRIYVAYEPLIIAEKAAFADKPEDCIFPHEAAIKKARDASERRKIEEEAHKQALETERWRLTNLLLAPTGLNKTVIKKIVEMSFFRMFDGCCDFGQFGELFSVNMNTEDAQDQEQAAVLRFLRNKSFTPFDAMGRVLVANWISTSQPFWICVEIFESGLAKPADFPAHHKEYEKKVAEMAKREKEKQDREAAQKSNQEDAA